MIRIAHRGIDCKYPENSLENLELAFQSDCDAVEIDLRSTKDGQLFIHHDGVWHKNGRFIFAKDETWDMINSPECAPQKNNIFGKIPTFTDVYSLFKQSNKSLFLEIKSHFGSLKTIDLLLEFFKGKSTKNIFISSFSLPYLRRFDAERQDFVMAKIGEKFYCKNLEKTDDFVSQIHFKGNLLNEKRMDCFHRRGWDVFAWTINEKEEFQRMENLGVKGIFTDNLDGLNQYLSGKK